MLSLVPNPAWLQGVAYDGATRAHRLDGRPALSVTQALSLAHPDRFAYVPPGVLARKAALGTAVHAAAQYHLEGDLDLESLVPDVQPHVAAWQWFCQTRRVEPLLTETVICSRRPVPFVGRLDALCVVDRSTVVLLDIKTGTPSLARLQTLAYLDALLEQYPALIVIDIERWAVQLKADGRYVIHTFRDDATDARDLRRVLAHAAEVTRMTHHPDEMPLELPDDRERDPLFDVPAGLPLFDVPDDGPGPVVLPSVAPVIPEVMMTPGVEAYVSNLEQAVAPYEAAAVAFAAEMDTAPVDTADALKWLGEQSLVAKEREASIEEIFERVIRHPRTYLDRIYAVRRRVLAGWQVGGKTAARRYTERWKVLVEADRKAQAEAEAQRRQDQQQRDAEAAEARQQLAQAAMAAAQEGDAQQAAELIELARAVEADTVPERPAPVALAPASTVPGLGERRSWEGRILDLKEAILASARPDILREIAQAVEDGDLTATGQSLTTAMIAAKLRAMANDLPFIPSTVFQGNESELKKRAAADRDTLQWPGFAFTDISTPVRRSRAR